MDSFYKGDRVNIWPFLLSFVFPLLLLLLPFALSYLKGKSALKEALKSYQREMRKANRMLGEGTNVEAERNSQEQIYLFELDQEFHNKIKAEFQLVDRYNYVYWLAKIFQRAPADKLTIESYFNRPPAAALFTAPRKRKKIVKKSIDNLSQMEPLNIGDLSEDFLMVTDHPSKAVKFFTNKTVQLLEELEDSLYYITVDHSPPHIKLHMEIKEDKRNLVFSAVKIVLLIANRIKKVKRPSGEQQTAKFLRKSITETLEKESE